MSNDSNHRDTMHSLVPTLRRWAEELGFARLAISDVDLAEDEARLINWLDAGYQGDMAYMAAHGARRSRPADLVPGTTRIISVTFNYLSPAAHPMREILADDSRAYVSRYALGRDYHKMMRQRLQRLADRIAEQVGPFGYRAFVDSAPVMERAIGRKAGLGWVGKHTNLLNRTDGSWFFLGELYTDLPLPVDSPTTAHCGTCRACIEACPTAAIVEPYRLDARLCIAYLTIEHHGAIPVPLRRAMGNRIYGCDDCQMVCPYNREPAVTAEPDFHPRHGLDDVSLLDLFAWSEATFLSRFEGSAIRRIGFERWSRNIAIALGNADHDPRIIDALNRRASSEHSALVREHIAWALREQAEKASQPNR